MCANARNSGRLPKSGGRCRQIPWDKPWHHMPTNGTSLSVRVMISFIITLAHLLDSLVRVTRRADESHRGTNAVSKPTYEGIEMSRRAFQPLRNHSKLLSCRNCTTLFPKLCPTRGILSIRSSSTRGGPEGQQPEARHQDNGGRDTKRGPTPRNKASKCLG